MARRLIKIIKKVDPRHAGITMLESPVFPEDEARDREFVSANAEQEYNFVVPHREVHARDIGSQKKSGPYGAYEILEPMEVPSGPAMPWYGQPGGGTQHKLPAKIEDLIESGKIRRKP